MCSLRSPACLFSVEVEDPKVCFLKFFFLAGVRCSISTKLNAWQSVESSQKVIRFDHSSCCPSLLVATVHRYCSSFYASLLSMVILHRPNEPVAIGRWNQLSNHNRNRMNFTIEKQRFEVQILKSNFLVQSFSLKSLNQKSFSLKSSNKVPKSFFDKKFQHKFESKNLMTNFGCRQDNSDKLSE